MKEEMLSISEAAKLMDVCENTLRDWDIEGKFKATRTSGGHRRYSLDQIRDYLDKNPVIQEKKNSPVHKEEYQGIDFWQEFIDEVDDINEKKVLSTLLSNAYNYHTFANNLIDDGSSIFSTKQTLWLVKESWLKSRFKKMVSVQPMIQPASLVYYSKQSDNSVKLEDNGISAKTLKLAFNFFDNAVFDNVKDIYAHALAAEIDAYIMDNLLDKIGCETLMDGMLTMPSDFIEEIKNKYEYIIGPEKLINKLKGYIKDTVDLFVIEDTLDRDSFSLIAYGGKYPTSRLSLPIFAPYILFFVGPRIVNSSVRSALSRWGHLSKSDVK